MIPDPKTADDRKILAQYFRIVNKQGQLVPLVLNRVQSLYDERKTRFDFILKARKQGISTKIIAEDILTCAGVFNTHAILLTHTAAAAETIMQERILPMLQNQTLGIVYEATASEIYFPLTKSRYYVGSAGSKRFGRGDDITRYHLSEFAHYTDPTVLTSVEGACTDNAIGRIETTANGDNFAKRLWDDSKNGKSRYRAIFFPWWADESYTIPGFTAQSLTEEEQTLMREFKLNIEQIGWRRKTIKEMSRPELFPQEYPENDHDAFLSSGRMVFDWLALLKQEQACRAPKWVGGIREHESRLDFGVDKNGHLSIWDTPDNRINYIIGADVAEGIKGGAFSAAFVLDTTNDEQVAEWHGHIAPDLFGQTLIDLSVYYNHALIVPESWPGPGAVTAATIDGLGYGKYLFKDIEDGYLGWRTTIKTKPQMIYALNAALRDLDIMIKSKDLLSELRSFVYAENGHMIPATGTFSDRVMAAAIAWMVSKMDLNLNKNSGIFNRSEESFRVPQWRGPILGVRKE